MGSLSAKIVVQRGHVIVACISMRRYKLKNQKQKEERSMKIICSKNEAEWIKKLILHSNDCKLDCSCKLNGPTNMYNLCRMCIEKNVEFEIKE